MDDPYPIQYLVVYKRRTWVIGDQLDAPTGEEAIKTGLRVLLKWQEKAGYYKTDCYSESIMVGNVVPDKMYFYIKGKRYDLALDKILQCAKIAVDGH